MEREQRAEAVRCVHDVRPWTPDPLSSTFDVAFDSERMKVLYTMFLLFSFKENECALG